MTSTSASPSPTALSPWSVTLGAACGTILGYLTSRIIHHNSSSSSKSPLNIIHDNSHSASITWDNLHLVEFGSAARDALFTIDAQLVHLNHGSFGTVPRLVLGARAALELRGERNPDRWNRYDGQLALAEARAAVAQLVGLEGDEDCVVLVENATSGVQCAVQSWPLAAGDEVVTFALNYNAVNNGLRAVCEDKGAVLVRVDVPLPVTSEDAIVDALEAALSDRVKLAVLDHITSATALVLPLKRLIDVCHARGVPVVVDGAHVVGQLELNLRELGADVYVSNLHKWLYTPRGCAMVYVARKYHNVVDPLVVSHLWKGTLAERFYMQATRDLTAQASALYGVRFYNALGGERIRTYIRDLAHEAAETLAAKWGTEVGLAPASMYAAMTVVRVPCRDLSEKVEDAPRESPLATKLMGLCINKHNTVAVFQSFRNQLFVRLSANIYNTLDDYLDFADRVLPAVLDECGVDLELP